MRSRRPIGYKFWAKASIAVMVLLGLAAWVANPSDAFAKDPTNKIGLSTLSTGGFFGPVTSLVGHGSPAQHISFSSGTLTEQKTIFNLRLGGGGRNNTPPPPPPGNNNPAPRPPRDCTLSKGLQKIFGRASVSSGEILEGRNSDGVVVKKLMCFDGTLTELPA